MAHVEPGDAKDDGKVEMVTVSIRASQKVYFHQEVRMSRADYDRLAAKLDTTDGDRAAAEIEGWLDLSNVDDGDPMEADDITEFEVSPD